MKETQTYYFSLNKNKIEFQRSWFCMKNYILIKINGCMTRF